MPLAVEFTVAAGETLALVGPSGAGKSSVLRAVAGLLKPAQATIRCGSVVWQAGTRWLPARDRAVGVVFQNYALFPHLTALGNVAEALGHRPRAGRQARARELLALVNLAGLEGRYPAALSGGQQQRVAVARALARDPKVLLLDEPFSAVDRSTRERLYAELASLRRQLAIPVILVTHDLDEAVMLADRLCVLHHGRGLQCDTPEVLMSRPLSAQVARLIGQRNVFEGQVVAHDEAGTWLAWGGRVLQAPLRPRFAVGQTVDWVIPGAYVVLHRPDKPSRGERENPVDGVVQEALALGDRSHLVLDVGAGADRPLRLSLPTHVLRRQGVVPGKSVRVSLLAEGIHLMTPS